MEVDKSFRQTPAALKDIYVRSSNGQQVPLSAFTRFEAGTSSLAINHQGQFPVVTISFNLAPGASLGGATTAIEKARQEIAMAAQHSSNIPGHRGGVLALRFPTNRC